MAISFNGILGNIKTPFVAVEFDNSRAAQGPALLAPKALLVGQKITAGTGTADSIVRVTNATQALTLAGRGSQLHRMAVAWFAANRQTECYLGILADNGAGTAGTKTLTLTGPATSAGTLSLYVAGSAVPVLVASGDTATVIGTAVAAAINAQADLPVTAANAAGVVTLTARNKGTCGNDLDVRVNLQDGEALPSGLAAVVATGVSGATNPTLTALLAAMGDTWFTHLVHPYTDTTSLTALETELASRAGAMRQIDCQAFTSAAGTQSTLSALGDTRNSQFSSIIAANGKNPVTPPPEHAASVVGTAVISLSADPARPLQTLVSPASRPVARVDEFTQAERNLLLGDGISTVKAQGGFVQIERLVTTYQLSPSGAVDPSYYDVNTVATLTYLRFSFRNRILSRFPRHKLMNDGQKVGSGQAIITPKIAKGECLAWFLEMQELGLVEGYEQFKSDLVVERDASDVNRLNFQLGPDLVNQFVIGAAQIQFRL